MLLVIELKVQKNKDLLFFYYKLYYINIIYGR